jgi:hypothetical protein
MDLADELPATPLPVADPPGPTPARAPAPASAPGRGRWRPGQQLRARREGNGDDRGGGGGGGGGDGGGFGPTDATIHRSHSVVYHAPTSEDADAGGHAAPAATAAAAATSAAASAAGTRLSEATTTLPLAVPPRRDRVHILLFDRPQARRPSRTLNFPTLHQAAPYLRLPAGIKAWIDVHEPTEEDMRVMGRVRLHPQRPHYKHWHSQWGEGRRERAIHVTQLAPYSSAAH